jgi:hypothetical protein
MAAEADLLVFSTRTILKNRDPWWEEEAFSTSDVGTLLMISLGHW